MNICLIGFGIPSLILANILAKKNIKISIFDEGKTKNNSSSRTIGITKNNIDYLKKEKIIIRNKAWKMNKPIITTTAIIIIIIDGNFFL